MTRTSTQVAPLLVAGRPRSRQARTTLVLAAAESARLLRHPLILIGATVSVFVLWVSSRGIVVPQLQSESGLPGRLLAPIGWGRVPELHLAAIETQLALTPLLGAAFLAALLTSLRARRDGAEELFAATPTAGWQRTAAHLLAGFAVGLLGLLLVVGSVLAQSRSGGAIGRPDPFEILAGPAAVVVTAQLGVLAATWLRSALYGPPLALAFALLDYGLQAQPHQRWLSLLTELRQDAVAAPLLLRPSGLHLLYLAGLAATICAGSLTRHCPRRLVLPLLVLALSATAVAGSRQLAPKSAADRARVQEAFEQPDQVQQCERYDGIGYCAFPEYRKWIPLWRDTVQSVVAELPKGTERSLIVRQVLPVGALSPDLPAGFRQAVWRDHRQLAPDEVAVGGDWGAGSTGPAALRLAEEVAAHALGLPAPAADGLDPRTGSSFCQAPAIVALWLMLQSDGTFRAVARGTLADQSRFTVFGNYSDATGRSYFLSRSAILGQSFLGRERSWGVRELSYAMQLAQRPTTQVATALEQHWRELTTSSATRARLVDLLRLRALPTVEQQLVAQGLDARAATEIRTQFELASDDREARC